MFKVTAGYEVAKECCRLASYLAFLFVSLGMGNATKPQPAKMTTIGYHRASICVVPCSECDAVLISLLSLPVFSVM